MIQRVAIASASACLALLLLACERSERSEVAAELDGVVITTTELDTWIKESIFQSQTGTPAELYELLEKKFGVFSRTSEPRKYPKPTATSTIVLKNKSKRMI